MADWKTYAKAARNTARKQAPEARDAAKRATARAGDYARAAGRAVEEGLREDDETTVDGREVREDRPREEQPRDEQPRDQKAGADEVRPESDPSRRDDSAESAEQRPDTESAASKPSSATASTSSRSVREEAKLYAAVASRTAQRAGKQARDAGIGGRIARAVRDALLIGASLLAIWGVLYAAGLPIPFSAVIIAVVLIVLLALAGGLYAQFSRDRARAAEESSEE